MLFVEQCGLHSNLQSPPHLPRFAFCFDTGIYILCLYRIVIMCHASQHATSLKNQVGIFSLSRNVRLTMPYYLRDVRVLTASSLRTKLKPLQ